MKKVRPKKRDIRDALAALTAIQQGIRRSGTRPVPAGAAQFVSWLAKEFRESQARAARS